MEFTLKYQKNSQSLCQKIGKILPGKKTLPSMGVFCRGKKPHCGGHSQNKGA